MKALKITFIDIASREIRGPAPSQFTIAEGYTSVRDTEDIQFPGH